MVDQSHNLKGKIEAMIQTVMTAQELFAKAALDRLRPFGGSGQVRTGDSGTNPARRISTDVRPAIREWRKAKTWRKILSTHSGKVATQKITAARAHKNASSASSYA